MIEIVEKKEFRSTKQGVNETGDSIRVVLDMPKSDWYLLLNRIGEINNPPTVCSFCGKNSDQVKTTIVHKQVCICDVCVELARDVIGNNRLAKKQNETPQS